MPNRIIKESICTSEDYARLTLFQRDLFIRLIVSVDDFGRYDARPAILRGKLYPLENVTTKAIDDSLAALASAGMIELYEVDGRPYLHLSAWEKHQYKRARKSKFPGPEDGVIASASNCEQVQADSLEKRETRIENTRIRETNICTEQDTPAAVPVITLTLNDKSEYPIYPEQAEEWAGLYPAVDVIQQLRAMRAWLIANPKKRKTANGILRFVNSWLSREQDKGGKARASPSHSKSAGADHADLDRLLEKYNA